MNSVFKNQSTDLHWSYHWNLGEKPMVFFSNPNARTNVIYTAKELQNILSRSDEDNSFIPVPRHVMESALGSVAGKAAEAA